MFKVFFGQGFMNNLWIFSYVPSLCQTFFDILDCLLTNTFNFLEPLDVLQDDIKGFITKFV